MVTGMNDLVQLGSEDPLCSRIGSTHDSAPIQKPPRVEGYPGIEKGLTILVALVSVVLVGGMLEQYAGLPPGPYCGQGGGRGKCCSGRLDSCAALITGTPCYCDEFCNRTRSSDCCPDYWSFCLGISEPDEPGVILSCEYGGKYFSEGQTIKVNCNECVCVGVTNTTSRLDCTNLDCIIEPRVNEEVNGDEAIGWTARNHSAFWGRTLEDGIKLRLGTLQPERTTMRMTPLRRVERARLPKSFDARSNWRNLIAGIIDQGWCGASWAISTATVASDRFSVMSKGKEHVLLSAQQLLSCNNRGQQSCSGGHLDRAWQYVRKFGLVDEACYPYDQSSGYCKVPKRGNLLEAGCKPLHNGAKRIERYRTSPAHRLAAQEDIMHEIFTSGPVQATMRVNQDFFSYSGGVYRKSTYGTPHRASYHSVRIIGWGEENGVPYWLAANSWGEEWGERGYFRIRRGVNECEIESFILGVWANVAAPYQRIYNHGTNQV